MSYLATLSRPVEMSPRPAAEPAPTPRAETFGEVHEEAVAAPHEPASQATQPHGIRSDDRAPSAMHDIEVFLKPPAAVVEATSRPSASRQPSPMAAARIPRSTPVVAQPPAAPATSRN